MQINSFIYIHSCIYQSYINKMAKQNTKIQRNFVQTTISQDLKCPICYDVFYRPRKLFCGHTFCKCCLKELYNTKTSNLNEKSRTCPLCKTEIDTLKITHDEQVSALIDELLVTCPVFGCDWQGHSKLLQHHYNHKCKMRSNLITEDPYIQRKSVTENHSVILRSANTVTIVDSSEQENYGYCSDDSEYLRQDELIIHQERICAQQYRQVILVPRKVCLTSRGVQTNPISIIQVRPEELLKGKKRIMLPMSIDPNQSQYPKIRRRRRRGFRNPKDDTRKLMMERLEKLKPKGPPLTDRQQLDDIKGLYNKLGLDFFGKQDKPKKKLLYNVEERQKRVLEKPW